MKCQNELLELIHARKANNQALVDYLLETIEYRGCQQSRILAFIIMTITPEALIGNEQVLKTLVY